MSINIAVERFLEDHPDYSISHELSNLDCSIRIVMRKLHSGWTVSRCISVYALQNAVSVIDILRRTLDDMAEQLEKIDE